MKKVFLIFTAIILASNFISIPQIGKAYMFQNEDCSFEYRLVPTKGGDIEKMINTFELHSKTNGELSDENIYRSFRIQPWKFWNWKEYLLSDIWKFRYKERCS